MFTNTGALLDGNTTILEASQFAIKSVKLFSSGGAEVTRVFPLSFLRSQDEPQVVEIAHLPVGLHSVQVSVASASGNVTVLDHYHFSDIVDDPGKNTSQRLCELQTERARLEDERCIRQQSLKFLATYMDSLAQCKPQVQATADQTVSFLSEFVEIGVTRSAAITELEDKVADLDDRIAEETDRLLNLSKELPVKVIAVLSCRNQAPAVVEAAELTVTYVIRNVSWKPEYDLRISMAGITPSPTVKLDFRCSVTQWTGENWENVSLVLTTSDQVSQLIQVSEPTRIDIRLSPAVAAFGPRVRSKQAPPLPVAPSRPATLPPLAALSTHHIQPSVSHSPAASASLPPATISITEQDCGTVSKLTSHSGKDPITHVANGSIFIPSDRSAHHVLVTSLALQAQFMRVVVPSVDTRVYYTCEVKNSSNYVLLPGVVKVYMNDKHVSSTDIHATTLPQILECPLAVDTAVKTIHNHAPEALPSVSEFTDKATTTYTSVTVIHNTHAEPIRGVVVRSAIPLPADPRITIMLKEPRGLANIDEGSVTVKEGCLARWSTGGGRKGKQAGLFEWVCDVDPGTEMVKAVWEVCAPQGLNLFEQIHS